MRISPFFLNLHSAYQAEMDDLTFDSDGRDVLRQRLADKRRQIAFLVQMMESSPEMVAVIFHQGFVFNRPALMDDLLTREADQFPAWSSLSSSIDMAPWTRELVQVILQAPRGEWFLTLVAGLHHLAGKPVAASAAQHDGESDDDHDGDDDFADDEHDELNGDGNETGSARSRREAGADWLAAQGFDRKD